MQTEARVGQRALNTAVVVDGAAVSLQQQQQYIRSLQSQRPQLGTVGDFLSGGIAGAFSKTCTAPLSRLTILFQVQGMHSDACSLRKACLWHEASRVVREEGFRAFWKGNLVTIAHRLPYNSISFYSFERYKNMLHPLLGLESQGDNLSTDVLISLVGGGLAGITAASLSYPLDLVRTRLAAQTNVTYYRGIWHALRTISGEEGALGLYKGLGATLLGVGPNLAISYSVNDTARSLWRSHRPNDPTALVSFACGSISGFAASTVVFPLDLVRRRMQLEGAGGRARVYTTGIFGTLRHITKTEGFRGLYRGILPEYYKVVPTVGIMFMTFEKLKQIFSYIPES